MSAEKTPAAAAAPPFDPARTGPAWPMDRIAAALQGLKNGHVTIHVQDGSVVLIERTEKTRIG